MLARRSRPPTAAAAHALSTRRWFPSFKQKFGYKNVLAVPRLEKIVISMGVGKLATAGEKGEDRAG